MLATEFGVSRWTLEEIMQWDNAALSHHVEGEWELASRAIADVDRRAATEALHNLLTLMQTREDALQVELSPLAAPQVYAETMLQLGRLLLEDGQTRSAHQLLKQCSEFLSEDGSGFPEFSRYQRATQLGTAYAFLDLGRDRRAEEAFKTLRTDLKTVISAMANQAPAAKHGREALAFKMMLLEVELGLLYLEEFSDEQFSNSLQTLEEAAAQLRSAPDSQRPYDFALWDARIRVELESLREQVPLEARCLGSMVAPATESSQAGVPRRFRTANDR